MQEAAGSGWKTVRSASAQTLPSPVSSTGGQPYDGGGQASLRDAQPADSGYVWAEALPPTHLS